MSDHTPEAGSQETTSRSPTRSPSGRVGVDRGVAVARATQRAVIEGSAREMLLWLTPSNTSAPSSVRQSEGFAVLK